MAIKDWKVTTDDKKYQEKIWENKKDKYHFVKIWKKGVGRWGAEHGREGGPGGAEKNFKTKSEALAYAKAYMKKH